MSKLIKGIVLLFVVVAVMIWEVSVQPTVTNHAALGQMSNSDTAFTNFQLTQLSPVVVWLGVGAFGLLLFYKEISQFVGKKD